VVHQASELSPEQRAAAELLLGRRLSDRESLSIVAFEAPPVSEEQRRAVSSQLKELFAKVDRHLQRSTPEEAEEIFVEAMRSSRPGYEPQQ
jgi:hypothetical protein